MATTTTQIAFTTDKQLKSAVNKRLKSEGSTFKGFFNSCMRAYLDKEIGFGIVSKEKKQEREKQQDDIITMPNTITTAEEFSDFINSAA